MTSIVDADDDVVRAAWAVVNGDAEEGRRGVRRVDEDDGTDSVYRIDPEADGADADAVRSDGEFPDADVVLWRADADLVEREVERRGLDE